MPDLMGGEYPEPCEVFFHAPDLVDREAYWGWQCFLCKSEGGDLPDIEAAEDARDRHLREEHDR